MFETSNKKDEILQARATRDWPRIASYRPSHVEGFLLYNFTSASLLHNTHKIEFAVAVDRIQFVKMSCSRSTFERLPSSRIRNPKGVSQTKNMQISR